MSANVYDSRFIGRGEPAWHGLGETFAADLRLASSEAVRRARVDYGFTKTPHVTIGPDGVPFTLPDEVSLWRDANYGDSAYRLGTVHPDYPVLPNLDLGELLDPLSKVWPVETVGALNNGEVFFITFRAGTGEVAGDEIQNFFLVTNSHLGRSALEAKATNVRVVCQNTLMSALGERGVVRVPHTHSGFHKDTAFVLDLMVRLRDIQVDTYKAYNTLLEKKLSREKVLASLQAIYAPPKKGSVLTFAEDATSKLGDLEGEGADILAGKRRSFATVLGNSERYVAHTLELYDTLCDEFPRLGGTAWALYNAVAEREDYGRWRFENDVIDRSSAVFGTRAAIKERAFSTLLKG